MPKDSVYADVANATVSILGKGGQGILVNDYSIITAAHCVTFSLKGDMVLGVEPVSEKIKTRHGELTVRPAAVEPVKDIAVLGELDNERNAKEAEEFWSFCDNTNSVPLCRSDFEFGETFPVHIYTHKGIWVTGNAKSFGGASLSVVADEQIESGTSGGPIINDSGELVGIVYNFTKTGEGLPKSQGSAPYPALALPVWISRRIFAAEGD